MTYNPSGLVASTHPVMTPTSQTALVTGATSGIGCELARLFAQDGISLVLVARQPELDAIKADFEVQYGIRVSCLAADLAAPGQATAVYRQCQEQGIELDYLVNNAGFGSYKNVVEEKPDLYENMLTLNVLAVTTLTALVSRDMVRHRRGRILNVGSTSAFQPVPRMAVCGASKSYVMNFTEALHAELRGTGVTATVLSPGVTATAFIKRAAMGSWSGAQGTAHGGGSGPGWLPGHAAGPTECSNGLKKQVIGFRNQPSAVPAPKVGYVVALHARSVGN